MLIRAADEHSARWSQTDRLLKKMTSGGTPLDGVHNNSMSTRGGGTDVTASSEPDPDSRKESLRENTASSSVVGNPSRQGTLPIPPTLHNPVFPTRLENSSSRVYADFYDEDGDEGRYIGEQVDAAPGLTSAVSPSGRSSEVIPEMSRDGSNFRDARWTVQGGPLKSGHPVAFPTEGNGNACTPNGEGRVTGSGSEMGQTEVSLRLIVGESQELKREAMPFP